MNPLKRIYRWICSLFRKEKPKQQIIRTKFIYTGSQPVSQEWLELSGDQEIIDVTGMTPDDIAKFNNEEGERLAKLFKQ